MNLRKFTQSSLYRFATAPWSPFAGLASGKLNVSFVETSGRRNAAAPTISRVSFQFFLSRFARQPFFWETKSRLIYGNRAKRKKGGSVFRLSSYVPIICSELLSRLKVTTPTKKRVRMCSRERERGPSLSNIFTVITSTATVKASAFVINAAHFYPRLMFAGEAGVYPS